VRLTINNDWFDLYRMVDGETLHDVSYKLYDTINYWWLLALINNTTDIHYDKLINNDVLQKLSKDQQTLELRTLEDWILFPVDSIISTSVGELSIKGEVLTKFVNENKYYIDVRLDDPDYKFPDECIIETDSEMVSVVQLTSSAPYKVGDVVRQDFITDTGSVEDFCRGHIIRKTGNNVYIYKTHQTNFKTTGEVVNINRVETTSSKLINLSNSIPVETYSPVLSTNNITEFQVSNSKVYYLLYIERYDKFEKQNDLSSVIKVMKKQYISNIQNLVISQLGN